VLDQDIVRILYVVKFLCNNIVMVSDSVTRPYTTDRYAQEVLLPHGLPLEMCEGADIYDLGCGFSDLQADLEQSGINASVTGVDFNPHVLTDQSVRKTRVINADLHALPLADESADIVIASYSLPLWDYSSEGISSFFGECVRILRSQGLLAVYPIAVRPNLLSIEPWEDRESLALKKADEIKKSEDWLDLSQSNDCLTAIKLR
jgi:ubiquinone/menaquinone biosynthesis C-methylase UbiE